MVFTDSKTNATLTIFVAGYEYYPNLNRYDRDWLDMGFCYHDERNHRYKLATDACISTRSGELRDFASMFREAATLIEVGEKFFFCPMEQMPQIRVTKTDDYAWQVQVTAILPNVSSTPENTYTVTDEHVTEWQLMQYADAFTDMAVEWPGEGKHCVSEEKAARCRRSLMRAEAGAVASCTADACFTAAKQKRNSQ